MKKVLTSEMTFANNPALNSKTHQFVSIENERVSVSVFIEDSTGYNFKGLKEFSIMPLSDLRDVAREIGKRWGSPSKEVVTNVSGHAPEDIASVKISNIGYNLTEGYVKIKDLPANLLAEARKMSPFLYGL